MVGLKELTHELNHENAPERLRALSAIKRFVDRGLINTPERLGYTNNHVHTQYSFSPYSPTKAVWTGYQSGLSTIGIMDHDTLRGAEEFIKAGEIMHMPTTIGFEIRTDWSDTKLKGKRINNPDQKTVAYIAAHGIPHSQIHRVDQFLAPVRKARNQRNRKMVDRINAIMVPHGLSIDFDRDVYPLSKAHDGGAITERHLLFALTNKILAKYTGGEDLLTFLTESLGINIGDKQKAYLTDTDNSMIAYDLLNVLKSNFVKAIYLDAAPPETPPIAEMVSFIKSIGAISSYCYLGDVGQSPTGDKKAQTFEDSYLIDVLDTCQALGFNAIAYMPSRNTREQLQRIIGLCNDYGFMQISGEDINQPRQSFLCEALLQPEYQHLGDTTWALVGHELAASRSMADTMFKEDEKAGDHPIADRIKHYRNIAINHYNL